MLQPNDLSKLRSQALLYFALPCLASPSVVLCGIPLFPESDPTGIVTLCCEMCSSGSHGVNNPGGDSASSLHDFAVLKLGVKADDVTKKLKQRIYRAGKDVLAYNSAGAKARDRRRRIGTQGHPTNGSLESGLLEWWADYRDAVSSRLDTASLCRASEVIQKRILAICKRKEIETPKMPRLNLAWVRGFCKRHHISLKKGTVRYKVSFEKVKRRTKRCWLNSIRVRYACILLYGRKRRELSLPEQPYLHVSDQKPLHYNESERN